MNKGKELKNRFISLYEDTLKLLRLHTGTYVSYESCGAIANGIYIEIKDVQKANDFKEYIKIEHSIKL